MAHRAVQRLARGQPGRRRGGRAGASRVRPGRRPDRPRGRRGDSRRGLNRGPSGILPADPSTGATVATTGLSADPTEYRERLGEQSDDQLDAWAAELMRDVAIRRGVRKVVADFRAAARLDEASFERVFASGGGPPAVVGRDAEGHLMVPAISLFALVPGIRSQVGDARDRLIEYLVANFNELVYV